MRSGNRNQFRARLGRHNFSQKSVEPGPQLTTCQLLDNFRAKKFSVPSAHRALQEVMIFSHDLLTSEGLWEP
jgi:hypothetical protein